MSVKRQGNTGVWTFVMDTKEGKVLAASQWGTNYEFEQKEWSQLPELPSTHQDKVSGGKGGVE